MVIALTVDPGRRIMDHLRRRFYETLSPGPQYIIGQERSREETALAAVCLGVIATVRLQRKVFI
jgi:hypothetical protein